MTLREADKDYKYMKAVLNHPAKMLFGEFSGFPPKRFFFIVFFFLFSKSVL